MGMIDFISHVSHWMEFPSTDHQPRAFVAKMDGRSTPVMAQTQMTNRQKATASDTPAYALRASARETVATTGADRVEIGASRLLDSVALEMSNFKSAAAGISGAGF